MGGYLHMAEELGCSQMKTAPLARARHEAKRSRQTKAFWDCT